MTHRRIPADARLNPRIVHSFGEEDSRFFRGLFIAMPLSIVLWGVLWVLWKWLSSSF